VNASIYLEGGGDSKELHTRCREGFRKLLENCGFKGRMPRLVACGGRNATFDDFKTSHMNRGATNYVAMLIDSEEVVVDITAAWEHLQNVQTVQKWVRPTEASDDQVLFMTTCMETWIVADRNTLTEHYGDDLQESALPPLADLEERPRHDIQDQLAHATRNCTNAYEKGKRSFILLGKLSPTTLQKLPSFARVRQILQKKL
jgi:hypothetical protein